MRQLLREVRQLAPDLVLLQWVPFLYSHRGTNLALPLAALALRREGFRIQIMVHEPWVALSRPSFLVTGPVQRFALGALITASQSTAVSIPYWVDLLRRRFPWKRSCIDWAPVGSNIPVVASSPSDRSELRRANGIAEQAPLLCVFSLYGAAKSSSLIESTWERVAAVRPDARIALIGASAAEAQAMVPALARDPRCVTTGYLPPADVSRWLSSCDLNIGAFTDGVSSRRTTVMAAMAHGLPVVATHGWITEMELFRNSPVRLVDQNPDAFSRELLSLIEVPGERARIAKQTREFFESRFAWDRIAYGLLSLAFPEAEAPAATRRMFGR